MSDFVLDPAHENLIFNICCDGLVSLSEVERLDRLIEEDGKVTHKEMHLFAALLKSTEGEKWAVKFSPEAADYVDTHFSKIKDKVVKELKISGALMGAGAPLAVVGGTCAVLAWPSAMAGGAIAAAGVGLFAIGWVIYSDDNNIARFFDADGRLISRNLLQ